MTDLFQAVCADNAAFLRWVAGGCGTVVGASILANARKVIPTWAMPIIDTLALNFIKSVEQPSPQAASSDPPAANRSTTK